MSEYVKVRTRFRSRALLRKALQAAGLTFEEALVGTGQTLELNGYGDAVKTADFAIRKSQLGALSDVGFAWNAGAGVYDLVLDDWDMNRWSPHHNKIRQEYVAAFTTDSSRLRESDGDQSRWSPSVGVTEVPA